jgi:RNA polymerase sigma-70 factor (ECF subfamily)
LRDAQAMHTWLFQIAANIWRDEQRRKRLQNSSRRKLQHGGDSRISVPEATASANEVRARALDGMNRLPQRQREVLYLSAVEKLSLEEIARTLEISKTAAKGSLCLARKKMRQWLKDFVPDTGKGE